MVVLWALVARFCGRLRARFELWVFFIYINEPFEGGLYTVGACGRGSVGACWRDSATVGDIGLFGPILGLLVTVILWATYVQLSLVYFLGRQLLFTCEH